MRPSNSVSVRSAGDIGDHHGAVVTLALLVGLLAVAYPAIGAPTIGVTFLTPTTAIVQTPTVVTLTVSIYDPALISGSVNLLRLGPNGTSTIVGRFHDDGQNGDTDAGDKLYTIQVTLNESQVGPVQFRVSAAFRGVLQRVLADYGPVFVQPTNASEVALGALSDKLVQGDVTAATTFFLDREQAAEDLTAMSSSDRSQFAACLGRATLVSTANGRRIYSVSCTLSSKAITFTVTMAPDYNGNWVIISR